MVKISEKRAVNPMMIANLAPGLWTIYKIRIDVVGKSEESTVLMVFTMATNAASS